MGKNCPNMGIFVLLIGKTLHRLAEVKRVIRSDSLSQRGAECHRVHGLTWFDGDGGRNGYS
jgi:hypothetical protein